ncbi:response regulator [Geobacter sp. FeAm09]|uniref:response regulator n=1 Tax=Geobacter sp. FeAm09 TaxID=2597769 RepID=UPI0011ED7833|nr:response regulator [Geobacter sp. FeAm09]QEM68925.1 response regulator [Geobacter sp. FeAm09]
MVKILIFEKIEKFASLSLDYLKHNGFEAYCLSNYQEIAPWVRENTPNLILLDLMLPGSDGIRIYKEIRAFSSVPIIAVIARLDQINALSELELEADGYICKLFSPREIVARVKMVLLQAESQSGNDRKAHRWVVEVAHS